MPKIKPMSSKNAYRQTPLITLLNPEEIANLTNDLIVTLDTNGLITFVNENGCKILGYQPQEILGKNWFDHFIPKKKRKTIRTVSEGVMGSDFEKYRYYENEVITKSGKERTFFWHNRAISDNDGNIIGHISAGTDITGFKKAIKITQESEQKFKALFEENNSIILLFDPISKRIIDVNQAGVEFYGYPKKMLLTKTLSDIIVLPEQVSLQKIKNIEKEKRTHLFVKNRLANGNICDVEIYSGEIRLAKNPIRYAIVHDITNRKKLETTLRESEIKYRMLVENSLDGILLIDKKDIIRFANLRSKDFTGYTVQHIIGKSITDFIFKKDLAKAIESHRHIMSGKSGITIETKILHKSGKVTPVISKGTVIQLNGEPFNLAIIRDISHEKEALKRLEQSEEKFRTIFEDSILPKMLVEVKTGKFRDVNKAACQFYGYSKEKMMQMTMQDLNLLPLKKFQIQTNQILTGQQNRFFLRHKTAKGKVKDVEVYSNKIEINNVPHLLYSVKDISEIKENQFFLHKAQDLANIGIWRFDFNTNEVIACHHAKKIYGYDENSELTIPMVQKVPLPQFRKELDLAIENIVKHGAPYDVEFQIRRFNDGAIRFIHSVAEYDKDKNELFGIIQDITSHKEIEIELTSRNEEFAAINEEYLVKNEELDDALKKAKESEQLKTAFLANMSHEIRTPMNGIIGFADLLKNSDFSKKDQKEFLEIIKNSGQQLLQIVNDILDYSKLEAGQMTVQKEKVSLIEVINEIAIDFSKRAKKKGLDFFLECFDSFNEVILETDRYKFIQILNNLLSNALKFTEKGQIVLECVEEKNTLKFFVRDSGIGIPPEKKAIIFERFRQVDEKLSRKYGGTGLGLSISKGFVKLLGGTIGVDSQRGVGSSFWFTLPYFRQTKALSDDKPENQNIFNWNDKTFLIVEDYLNNQKFLEVLLKPTGVKTLVVETGKQAIEMVRSHPEIDVVLMDIKLPDITGYKATREIRKFNKEVIIIAQTAYAFENDRAEAINCGCNAYISKPINRQKLLQIIDLEYKK